MNDVVIKAENLSKIYRLGMRNHRSFQKYLQTLWNEMCGREDPNSLVHLKHERYEKKANIFWALDNINFEVRRGERVGLVGSNGAGKSTLLKLLSRVTRPTDGYIKIVGRVSSMLEVGTGFHPELTGRENVFLNGTILGMNRKQISQQYDAIVAFSDIKEFVDTPVKRYSSGMYLRLAFAIAAHLNSDIMVIDEVLAVGDPEFQQKCIRKIQEISSDYKKTIIFVSHNPELIKSLCSSIIRLDRGKIIERREL